MPSDSPSAAVPSEPLGLRNPLLPSQPLGQNWLRPTFLTPLGATALTVLNPTVFSSQAAAAGPAATDFEDSPFFKHESPFRNLQSNRPQPVRSTRAAEPPSLIETSADRSRPTPSLTIQTRFEPISGETISSGNSEAANAEKTDPNIVSQLENAPAAAEQFNQTNPLEAQSGAPFRRASANPPTLQARLNPAAAETQRDPVSIRPPAPAPSRRLQAAEPTPALPEIQPRSQTPHVPSVQTDENENSSVQPENSPPSPIILPVDRTASSTVNAIPATHPQPDENHRHLTESTSSVIQTASEARINRSTLKPSTQPDLPDLKSSLSTSKPSTHSDFSNSKSSIQEAKSDYSASVSTQNQQNPADRAAPEPISEHQPSLPAPPAPPALIQPRLEAPTSPLPTAEIEQKSALPSHPKPVLSAEVGLQQASSSNQALWSGTRDVGDRKADAQPASPSHQGPSHLQKSVASNLLQSPNLSSLGNVHTVHHSDLTEQPTTNNQQPTTNSVHTVHHSNSTSQSATTSPDLTDQPTTTADFGVPESHPPLAEAAPPATLRSELVSLPARPRVQRQVDPVHPRQERESPEPDTEPDTESQSTRSTVPLVSHSHTTPSAPLLPQGRLAPTPPELPSSPTTPALEEHSPELPNSGQEGQRPTLAVSAKQNIPPPQPAEPKLPSSSVSIQQKSVVTESNPAVTQQINQARAVQRKSVVTESNPAVTQRVKRETAASVTESNRATAAPSAAPSSSASEIIAPPVIQARMESGASRSPGAESPNAESPNAESEPLPQVPTVLTNVSVLKPLAASRPLTPPPSLLSAVESVNRPPSSHEVAPTPSTDRIIQPKSDRAGAASSPNGSSPPVVSVAPIRAGYSLPALASPGPSPGRSASGSRPIPSATNYAIPDAWSSVEELLSRCPTNYAIPDAWSSVEELLSRSPTPTVQRFIDQEAIEELAPQRPQIPGFQSPELNSDDSLAALLNDGLPSQAEPEITTAHPTSEPDVDLAATPAAQSGDDRSNNTERGHSSSSGEESDGLESLAQTIYGLLRQRLEIERERQGHFYSGRLPW